MSFHDKSGQRGVRTVRVQLTLISALLVAVALAVAGAALAIVLNFLLDSAGTADGAASGVLGANSGSVDRTVVLLVAACCVIFPVIVLTVGWLSYRYTGRALQSVEDIRAEAAAITGGDLSRRLPVPASDDEIAALARTMNEMLARVERARTRQLQFVNDASHELNSPLTSIIGIVDLAAATGSGIDADTVRTLLRPESLQLKRLVSDMLFLARADENGVPRKMVDVDFDDVVGEEVIRLRQVSGLTVNADIRAARVFGDRSQLTRAIRNLGDNAAQHARTEIALAMEVDMSLREVTITVSDDGPGIPEAERNRVFERFVRLDDSRERRAGGSGLGLAIVAEIVQAHDGRIDFAEAPTGTAVRLTLPLGVSALDPDRPGQPD